MDIEPLRIQFAAEYYHWALKDAQREVCERFRLLRKVKNTNLSSLLNWLDLHSPKEQIEFFEAMIKHGHRRAAEMAGETLSPSEEMSIQRSRQIWLSPTKVKTDALRQKFEGTFQRCSRPKLASLVRRRAKSVLGEEDGSSGSQFRSKTEVSGFIVRTCVNFGGQFSDMSYYHLISTPSGEKIKHSISLLGWLGMSQTDWKYLTDADIETAAKDVVEICEHFLNAAGSLLKSLKVSG